MRLSSRTESHCTWKEFKGEPHKDHCRRHGILRSIIAFSRDTTTTEFVHGSRAIRPMTGIDTFEAGQGTLRSVPGAPSVIAESQQNSPHATTNS